jgi:hypothetical protein
VLGLCRFSYPANLSDFQTRHATIEDRKVALYNPQRLEQRFFLFEQFLLPAIKAQTDKNFTLMILMGDDFPEPYRARMLAHCDGCPQLKPTFKPTGPHRDVYRELFLESRDLDVRTVAEFRLDDDDAVAVDFVEKLRETFGLMRPIFSSKGRALIDFTKGLVVQPRDLEVKYIPTVTPFWAAGLAIFSRPKTTNCVMDYAHQKAFQFIPSLCLSKDVMYLRGDHATNDSHIGIKKTLRFKMPNGGAPMILRNRFAVDIDQAGLAWRDFQNLSKSD